jgi:predicted DNA-binding ribbon-helix-helix protein
MKRSVTLSGHRTSLSLEPVFWKLLRLKAAEEETSLAALVTTADRTRLAQHQGLSSAVRVMLAQWLAAKAGLSLT